MAYMPASSRELIAVPWGADAVDYPVEIAIVAQADGEPADDDYKTATWDGTDATLLIGADTDTVLEAGVYVIWTRITAGTERPVRRAGLLTVGTP